MVYGAEGRELAASVRRRERVTARGTLLQSRKKGFEALVLVSINRLL